MRATFYVSLFSCIIAVGAVVVLADRFEKLSMTAATSLTIRQSDAAASAAEFNDLRLRIDDVRAKLNATVGHAEARHADTLRVIRTLGSKNFILFLGDSITEFAELPDRVCGIPVVNAGIGGSRASDFLPFVEDIFSAGAKPSATVVALGINDAQSIYWNKSKERHFNATYDILLNMLPPGAMLTTLTPIDISQKVGKRFSPAAWSAINLAIRDAAAKRNATLIDLGPQTVASGTIDGVHPDENSYLSWREKLTEAIKKKLRC